MAPPTAQQRRAYAAIMAFHSSRTSALSGLQENHDGVTTNTPTITATSTGNEETLRNAASMRSIEVVSTPIPVTATTSSSRTSSSSSNFISNVSIRGDAGHFPVLRNMVSIASGRGRTALQNGSHPNNIHHLTSSSSNSSSSHRSSATHHGPPAVHPQFRSKAVCKLTCSACTAVVCSRGMKAILLADTRVELYSTDTPPIGVQLVNDDYMTRNCRCRIRDVACLGCGSVVGYHVTTPCSTCLDACNNGHFWMFHAEGIHSSDRMDETGTKTLLWATIPCAERDLETFRKLREYLCR